MTHFSGVWEIWDQDIWPVAPENAVLLLTGTESGTTTDRPGLDGKWRANGIVTEASEEFEDWIGRQVHDGGNVIWGPPPSGEGIFRIN